METRASYLLVGSFTLLIVIGALLFVLWTAKTYQGDMRTYEIAFNQSVSGLSTGSSVFLEGVKVGQVDSIKVSHQQPGEVLVRISVLADAPIRKNSEAVLEPQGITGTSAVAVSSGTVDSPLLQPGQGYVARIPSRLSRLQAIMNSLPSIMSSLDAVAANTGKFLSDENAVRFSTFMNSLAEISDSIAQNRTSLDKALKGFGEAGETFSSAASKLNTMIARGQTVVDKDLRSALNAIEKAGVQLEAVMKTIGPGMSKLSRESVDEMQNLLVEARRLVMSMARISGKIESDPRQFLLGNPVPEFSVK